MHAVRRIAALAFAVAVVATLAPPARACSCAGARDPRETFEHATAAFIGHAIASAPATPSPTPSSSTGPSTSGRGRDDIRFEVEEDFKDNLPGVITVYGAASPCGFGAPLGKTVAMYLYRSSGRWASSACEQTTPEMLRKVAAPLPAPDGSGPPRFVLGGSLGPVRTFSLDDHGRTLRYARGPGITAALDLCPGSRVVAELVQGVVTDEYWKANIATRDVSTLALRTEYGFSSFEGRDGVDDLHPQALACLDAEGRTLAVAGVHDNRVGAIVRVRGEDETTIFDGQLDAVDFSDDGAKAFVSSCTSLLEVDVRSGVARKVATIPPETLRVDAGPDGRHALYSSASDGRSDGRCHFGHTPDKGHFIVDLATGRSTRISLKLFGYLWADARTFVAVTKDGAVHLYDVGRHELASWPGWGDDGVVVGGVLYASSGAGLRAAVVRTGPARVLRHFDYDQEFELVVVPPPPATALATSAPSPAPVASHSPPPAATIGPQAEPASRPASGGVLPGLVSLGAAIAAAAAAILLKRRTMQGR